LEKDKLLWQSKAASGRFKPARAGCDISAIGGNVKLDHLAITCADLAAGVAWAEARLGLPLLPGGRHARYGTHNRLLGLEGGLYLEVIAPDPDAPAPPHPRWFGLDAPPDAPRLGNWICAVPDLDAALAAAPQGCGAPVDLTRGDLSWRIAVPPDGGLPMGGAYPTLITWGAGVTPPGARLPGSGVALTELIVQGPDAGHIAAGLPLDDPRVVFRPGPVVLSARFRTPSGDVWL